MIVARDDFWRTSLFVSADQGRDLDPGISPAHTEHISSPARIEPISSPARIERGRDLPLMLRMPSLVSGLKARPASRRDPERIRADGTDVLTSGHPGVESVVTVKKVRLSSDTREVIISGASGI